jgi:hypothetical protein
LLLSFIFSLEPNQFRPSPFHGFDCLCFQFVYSFPCIFQLIFASAAFNAGISL